MHDAFCSPICIATVFAIVQLFVAKNFQYELTVMLMRNKVITSLKFYTCYAVLGLRLNLQVKNNLLAFCSSWFRMTVRPVGPDPGIVFVNQLTILT